VGMEDSQNGRTPDQADNEVRLESDFVEFTESNENNETVQTVTVNCKPADVNLESEFNDNNEFTESNTFTESDEFTESNEDNEVNLTNGKVANDNKTFARLIAEALDSAPGGMLAALDICKAISAKHPQYKMNNSNWKKVWNNLSRNKNFVKGTKPKSWKLKQNHKIFLHERKELKEDHKIFLHERKDQISKSFDPFSCDLCDAQFAQTRNLSRHFQTFHEKKKSFKCSICRKKFGAKQTLERHFVNVHKLDLDESKKLSQPTSNQGKEFDENKRPFSCPICDKAFAAKQTLQRHVASIHKQDYYFSTNHGEKVTPKPSPIKNAEKKEKKCIKIRSSQPIAALFDLEKLECKTCDGSFATKNAFLYHIEQFHSVTFES